MIKLNKINLTYKIPLKINNIYYEQLMNYCNYFWTYLAELYEPFKNKSSVQYNSSLGWVNALIIECVSKNYYKIKYSLDGKNIKIDNVHYRKLKNKSNNQKTINLKYKKISNFNKLSSLKLLVLKDCIRELMIL